MGARLIACIVIAGGKRTTLIDTKVLPSILPQGFDDVLVVGEHHAGDWYRYLHVPGMMRNTNDALVKRDVGTVATEADILVYLSDDHGLRHDFLGNLRSWSQSWDALMPHRYCIVNGEEVPLNMGQSPALPSVPDHRQAGIIAHVLWKQPDRAPRVEYIGGHAGVFRRWVIQRRPWTTMPHDRIWDVLASKEQMALGARFEYVRSVQVEDYETEGRPWQ